MRINTIVTLGASAAFGIMSIFLARSWINDAVSARFAGAPAAPTFKAPPSIETVSILVADMDLNFGDRLEPQHLRLVNMPQALVPVGSFTDFNSMFGDGGRPAVVLTQMRANEPILDYKISGPGGRGSLSALIKDGYRAASIRVNAVAGVSGFVLPGDHVDVILTRDLATGEQERRLTSDVLLQNVKVLGADQSADTTSGQVKVAGTVTLEVLPAQAQKLALATDIGSLSLTLRQNGETQIMPITSLSEKHLTSPVKAAPARGRYAASKPAATRPYRAAVPAGVPTAKVNIIRSGARESVSVRKEIIEKNPEDFEAQTLTPALAGAAKG